MPVYSLPYGRSRLLFTLPDTIEPEIITLAPAPPVPDPEKAVGAALDSLLGGVRWEDFSGARSAAIAINDKTRPVPHHHLLPPLLARLEGLGLAPADISLIIATGTHPPLHLQEYAAVLPPALIDRYPVLCHDSDNTASLVHLGRTRRGTPVWIHAGYARADLRIVVGNIEPHQFQGFSGGVKSAAIGLAGRETINHNHAMMTAEAARLGEFDHNPARQDVEEIGRMIGVHMALNGILNDKKEIVQVLAGAPAAVLGAGIPLARQICQAAVAAPFDLIIAAPGGHPKDINVYQSQKGLAHAALVTRSGGTVILAAACPEGSGSRGYERWVAGMKSHEEVLVRFAGEGFRVGPHKAFQIARDATRVNLVWISEMAPAQARRLLLNPAASLQEAVDRGVAALPPGARVAIMPRANATIPNLGHHPPAAASSR